MNAMLNRLRTPAIVALLLALAVVPWVPQVVYPVFVMKLLCMALFACAYSLLLGFGGMMSFGHAAFFGSAAYITGLAAKTWGLTPELALLAGTMAANTNAAVNAAPAPAIIQRRFARSVATMAPSHVSARIDMNNAIANGIS